MEAHEGFIVGIYNFCDRWCERCAFTSRCRSFADGARLEAFDDPALQALVDAPPLPQDISPPPPRWMQDIIEEMNQAANEPLTARDLKYVDPKLPADHERILARAKQYGRTVYSWLRAHDNGTGEPPGDPRAVIAWFHTLVPVKIHRALKGLGSGDWDDLDCPPDYDGSAKVALLGVEESHVAWLRLQESGGAEGANVQAVLEDLVWLGEELERVFPKARAFVRPGFDEPDAVARLRAEEGRR